MTKKLFAIALVVGVALLLVATGSRLQAQQGGAVAVDGDDLGGVVRSSKGLEPGVWVIAQTKDLPTTFTKIVVTDDQGRYVVPDLPKANYSVWVRGYGLVDSPPVSATPGRTLNLTAALAPSSLAAAQYYPASYWLSMIRPPAKSEFPMGPFQTQADWVMALKGSVLLNQIGDKATREIPEKLGRFRTTREAWQAWVKSPDFPYYSVRLLGDRGLDMLADWTDRIHAGEVPPAPPRPQGLERNLVITQWDWGRSKSFVHDLISSDRNNPTVNANGPLYGIEQHSGDVMDVLDPVAHKAWHVQVPVKDPTLPNEPQALSVTIPLTWGEENVRPGIATLHNPMMDHQGRVWITAKFRKGQEAQPPFCKQGSDHPSAKFFPLVRNTANGSPDGRQVEVYDPKTKQFAMVDLCFGTHHLDFAEDANHTLWFSGGTDVMGWLNTKLWDETHDDARAQGWTPYVVDTNGNGKPDPGWVEMPPAGRGVAAPPALDGTKDLRVRGTTYGLGPAPDGSVWGAVPGGGTGYLVHVIPGPNPPSTTLTEIYRPPSGAVVSNLKGVNVDRSTGMVWAAFAHSGTLASFDRRKCKILNGSKATGDHCPEGWMFYPTPGPKLQNVTDPVNADYHYLQWVDQHDIFGLGPNTPLVPGTNSDSVIAFQPNAQRFLQFVVPYPMGFYTRGIDGRIDDPKGGWKGRALWTTYASVLPWNYEGGINSTPKAVKLQLRPNPLAK